MIRFGWRDSGIGLTAHIVGLSTPDHAPHRLYAIPRRAFRHPWYNPDMLVVNGVPVQREHLTHDEIAAIPRVTRWRTSRGTTWRVGVARRNGRLHIVAKFRGSRRHRYLPTLLTILNG